MYVSICFPQILFIINKIILKTRDHRELTESRALREIPEIRAQLEGLAEMVRTAFVVRRVTQVNQDHLELLANPVEMEWAVLQVRLEPKLKERKYLVLQGLQAKMAIQELWVYRVQKVNGESEEILGKEVKMVSQDKEDFLVFLVSFKKPSLKDKCRLSVFLIN